MYQLLPFERTCEWLQDLFSCPLSEGTLGHAIESFSDSLEEPVQEIATAIQSAPVAHFDETSCSVQGQRQWIHVASTNTLTPYSVQTKRGKEATKAAGILPAFSGRAVQDPWKPYFTYTDCTHALCKAHPLRELIFVDEQLGQAWAKARIDFLLDAKNIVEQAQPENTALSEDALRALDIRYQTIIDKGYGENPLPHKPPGQKKKRGRMKKSTSRNLLERLDHYRNETLALMYDFHVPFDNNLAERDIRMTKVQQKISGTFRGGRGAQDFCRIRSYVSTARKNLRNAISVIREAFVGNPYSVLDSS